MRFVIQRVTHASVAIDGEVPGEMGLKDVEGELMLISQFTLYADCRKGNRPSFTAAGAPDLAEQLYEYIKGRCAEQITAVRYGEFGADMKVELLNDGPFTVILDSADLGC